MADPDAGPLVLVVEDDEGTRRALRALLELHGYRVADTASGEEAIELAHALRPAVVLLDVVLPRISGLEAVRHLRQNPDTAPIPVIATSATWPDGPDDAPFAAGFDGTLRKPYDAPALFGELERVLGPAAPGQEPELRVG